MRFLVIIFSVILLSSCGKGMNKILKSKDPAYKLRMAEEFYAKKKYGKAQTIFEDIVPYYKTTPQFQDLYYKYAYSAYNQKDYTNAENLFKNFLESFPNSPRTEEIEYMRAYSYYKQAPKPELDPTNTNKAILAMQSFVNNYPNSVRVTDASRVIEELRLRLETKAYKAAKLYYDMGQFNAAGVTFTNVLDDYPESKVADEYKYMAVKSFYRWAEMSIADKKSERFQKVITESSDFIDRFPESKYRSEIDNLVTQSKSEIVKYEQVKKTT